MYNLVVATPVFSQAARARLVLSVGLSMRYLVTCSRPAFATGMPAADWLLRLVPADDWLLLVNDVDAEQRCFTSCSALAYLVFSCLHVNVRFLLQMLIGSMWGHSVAKYGQYLSPYLWLLGSTVNIDPI